MAQKKKKKQQATYNAITGEFGTTSGNVNNKSNVNKGYDATTGKFYDIAPVNTSTAGDLAPVKKKNNPTDILLGALNDAQFLSRASISGILTGLTGVVDAPIQGVQEQVQKGKKIKTEDDLKKEMGIGLLRGLVPGVNTYLGGKETREKVNKIWKDKDKSVMDKVIGTGTAALGNEALDNTFQGLKSSIRLLSAVDPKLDKKVDKVQKTIDKPSEKLQKDIEKEMKNHSQPVQFFANTNQIVGNMIPSVVATALTKNPNAGLALMGVGAKGQATKEALQKGADIETANDIGVAKGLLEVGTEKISGGLKIFGKTPLDEGVEKIINDKIGKKGLNFLAKQIVGIGGEIAEETISDVIGTLIDKGTIDPNANYTLDDWLETLTQTGASTVILNLIGGGYTPKAYKQNALEMENSRKNSNNRTLTNNENAVLERETQNRINELEKDGKKLTKKERSEIKNQVKEDLTKGYISTDVIESTLGGETYNNLNSVREQKKSIQNEINELENKPNAEITVKENERLQDLRKQLKEIDTTQLEGQLQNEMQQRTGNDYLLQRSYNEKALKSKQFTYKANNTDSDIKKSLYESASRVMNDSTRSHEFADTVAKIAEDRETKYLFTNNEELSSSKYNIKGKTINGLVDENGNILINVDSNKALNSIVGHETTHLLEGTKEYNELQDAIISYAKTKGDYQNRIDTLNEVYKGVKGANIKNELTSDLVGDYLFNDQEFVNDLSTKKPSLFKKIKNLIDDLVVKFKGTKEEKQLREVQKKFEKAYMKANNQNSKTNAKYSLNEDNLGNKLSKEQQEFFKDSKIRDENGNLEVMYHGTPYGGFTIFDDSNYGSGGDEGYFGHGYYFTNNKNLAKEYSDADFIDEDERTTTPGEYGNVEVKEVYLNIKNPYMIEENNIEYEDGSLEKILNTKNSYESTKKLKETGYDGIVYTFKDGVKEVTAFYPEQIKNINNTNPTDNPDIRYSISEDSQGNKLSNEQKEYFKYSKVRDEEGKLIPLYHGTGADFTVFDRDLAGSHGTYYGAGFYLTPSKENARGYAGDNGNIIESYVNITNPYIPTTDTINEDGSVSFAPSFYEDFENRFKDQLPQYWNDDLTNRQKGRVVRNVLQDNGYDGIIVGDTYVAFEPEQIKNMDNTNPTSNPDIRYSLTDNKGRELSENQQEYFKYSEVRDDEGRLLEVYHGTPNPGFTIFETNRSGENTNSAEYGLFFTDSEKFADDFSYERIETDSMFFDKKGEKGDIYKAYLNAENVLDFSQLSEQEISNLYDYASYIGQLDGKEKFISNMKNWQEIGNHQLMKGNLDLEKIANESIYDGIKAKLNVKGNEHEYIVFDSNQVKSVDNFDPTDSPDIRYSLDLSDQKNARFTEDRLDYIISGSINDYSGGENYARDYVVRMTPQQFLDLTTTPEVLERIEKESRELSPEDLAKERQNIYLRVDMETGEVLGHEGRHRMLALQKAGFNTVDVDIEPSSGTYDRYNAPDYDTFELKGQEFRGLGKGTDTTVHDLIAVSANNVDKIKNEYLGKTGKNDIRYSLAAPDTEKIEAANELEAKGLSPEEIYMETGTFRSADGKWRTEIDDSEATIKLNGAVSEYNSWFKLKDLLEHKKLYNKYPFLKDVDVYLGDLNNIGIKDPSYNGGVTDDGYIVISNDLYSKEQGRQQTDFNKMQGDYQKEFDAIKQNAPLLGLDADKWINDIKNNASLYNPSTYQSDIKSTLLHEIQHIIQDYEGFAKGANVKYWKNKINEYNDDFKYYYGEFRKRLDATDYDQKISEFMEQTDNYEDFAKLRDDYIDKLCSENEELNSFKILADTTKQRLNAIGDKPYQAYMNTAGEEEARNTSSRMNLNEEQRAKVMPYNGNPNTLFAEEDLNEEKYGVRFSLDNQEDNQGRKLSPQQQEYFSNSKVRDNDGNLLEVYHGTDYDFTIFNNPTRKFNEYASGKLFAGTSISMFTDSQEVAQTYIDNEYNPDKKPMSVYLNITNPYIVDAERQNNKYFFDNDGKPTNVNTLVKRIYDSGKYDGVIIKNVADVGNYYDYDLTDGNQYATDYIVFNSNQVKNVNNLNPTDNPDIRYSVSPSGEMVDNSTGEKVTLDVSDTGNTGTLMAIHNLNEDKLKGILELGGFPVPSIAVTNPNIINHKQFGNISVLFDKSTIDPAIEANEIYDRDVWSPTFPEVDYEIKDEGIEKVAKDLGIEDWKMRDYAEDNKRQYLVERLLRDEDIINKYVKDNKINYETAYKEAETRVDMHQRGEKLRKFIIDNDFDFRKLYKDQKLQQEYFNLIKDYYDNSSFPAAVKENLYNEKITQLKDYIDFQKGAGDLEPVRQLIRYQNDFDLIKSGDNKVIDEYQTNKNKRDAAIANGIEKYLDNEINSLYGEKGIYNGKEYLTSSGRRRSFWELHDEYNLDNIVDALTSGDTKGTQNWIAGFGQIQAQMGKRFNSISDIKASEGQLTSLEETNIDLENAKNAVKDDIDEIVARNDTEHYIASELLADFAKEDLTVDNFKKLTKNYYQTTQNVPDSLINKIIDDLNNLRNLPTDYFEAKPQRAVGLDEVQAIIIPSDTDTEFKQQLQEEGLKYYEYDPNIEGDRNRVINQFDDLKFSLSNEGEDIAPVNGWNVRGEDVRLQKVQQQVEEAIAPLQEEIKTLNQNISDLQREFAPISEEEAELMSREHSESINSLTEADMPPRNNLTREETKELNDLEALDEVGMINYDMEDRLRELQSKERGGDIIPDSFTLDEKNRKLITKNIRKELDLTRDQAKELESIIKDFDPSKTSREELFDLIKEKYSVQNINHRNEELMEIKDYLRNYPIKVDANMKSEFADGFNKVRQQNFGKLRLTNKGTSVDSVYAELNGTFGNGYFPEDIINPQNQLSRIIEVVNMDPIIVEKFQIPDDVVEEMSDYIYDSVLDYRDDMFRKAALETSRIPYDESLIPQEINSTPSEEIAPIKENIVPESVNEEKRNLTVKEANTLKLNNLENQLNNMNQQREQSYKDFNQEIYALTNEYADLNNKKTKKAVKMQQRIENLKTLRDNTQIDYERRMDNLQKRIDKMNSKEFKTAEQRQTKQQDYRELAKNLIGNTFTWKDKKMGIQYQVNTMKRNLRDIIKGVDGKADIAKADRIYDEYFRKYDENQAKLNKEADKYRDKYRDLKINPKEHEYIQMLGEYKYNPATTLTADQVQRYLDKNKSKINEAKVDKVIEMAKKDYDELFNRVNETLKAQGMAEIPYRQGYFPHFVEDKQSFLQKMFDWKPKNDEIPTDIAGLTELNNPERSWQSFNKERKGDTTTYNFGKGFDTYLSGALDWIYHIEDIQKVRALENEIRYQHSDKGIQEQIEEVYADPTLDTDQVQEKIDSILANSRNPLNNFVTDLRNWTNNVAGKKSTLDRSLEYATNRKIYSTMTNISNRVSGNMVGGSVSSALTNFIPITQSWGTVSPVSTLQAMKDTIKSTIKDDGFVNKSNFLTNRLNESENLYKSNWDKARDKAAILFDSIDSFVAQTVTRSKYMENIKNGMSEAEAIKNADQYAKDVIGGRSKGDAPTIFNSKNPVTKMLTAFQLEVNNQYAHMFKDMPQDIGSKSKARLVKGYASMFIGAYVYNALYSALVGRDAAFDPIGIIADALKTLDDDDKDPEKKFESIFGDVVEQLPFVGGLFGGGRVPISGAIPYEDPISMVTGTTKDLLKTSDEEKRDKAIKDLTSEWLKPVTYLALPFGGGQIKKSLEGLSMFNDNLPVTGSYTNSGDLRYPVEDTPLNRIQAGIFGRWANKNAQEYLDRGEAPLKEKQIKEYKDLDIPISEYWDYRKGLKKQKKVPDKFDYISDLKYSDEQKNIMINNAVNRKKKIDMSDYDLYNSYEEFDFATKNPEKYEFFQENNISYEEYSQNEETKKAYSWAFNNPDSYYVSKAITNDLVYYRQICSELDDIKADKYTNGKTVPNSRKRKVFNYINSLEDLSYEQKTVLAKMEYNSFNQYNQTIINYLNNDPEIDYNQEEIILKKLGFKVDANGNIRW